MLFYAEKFICYFSLLTVVLSVVWVIITIRRYKKGTNKISDIVLTCVHLCTSVFFAIIVWTTYGLL